MRQNILVMQLRRCNDGTFMATKEARSRDAQRGIFCGCPFPVEFLYCDLASMMSIRQFVQKFKMKKIPLHVLINNGDLTLLPRLEYSGAISARSSYTFSCLPCSACYSAHAAYAQSKLALVLFTYHLQRLLAAEGSHVTANVVDPGVVDTDLYRHVFWGTRLVKKLFSWLLFKTPDEGAWTSIYAAVTPELEGVGGRYLYNEKETKSLHVTYNQKLQQQLWSTSCDMTGVRDVTL
uniref:Dehydrogenase/reductase X-linked n=1 Tax=Rhinopithecus bieti TaxID=61621 RepID=A0A2K6KPP8_RHIBE